MQFCANDLFDHARTNPVVAIGIFGAPCVKYLLAAAAVCIGTPRFGQVQGNRQVLMHRVDMTARSFKFAINDFLKGVVTIPLPALEVEKTFNNTSPLTPALAANAAASNVAENTDPIRDCKQAFTVCPSLLVPRGGLRSRPPLTQVGRVP